MGFKNNSKKKIDLNFKKVIKILDEHKIQYWLCHGTLLGVIRDKQLIPWDHDIDIAVWDSKKIANKIKNLICKNNFYLKKKYYQDDGLLTFTKLGGREVDINFYKKKKFFKDEIAYVRWYIPKNSIFKLIDALASSSKYNGKYKQFIKLFSLFEFIFLFIKEKLIEKKLFYKAIGYTQPMKLLKNFKKINFCGVKVIIPKKYNEYLNYVYGKNWIKPVKKFDFRKSPSIRNV